MRKGNSIASVLKSAAVRMIDVSHIHIFVRKLTAQHSNPSTSKVSTIRTLNNQGTQRIVISNVCTLARTRYQGCMHTGVNNLEFECCVHLYGLLSRGTKSTPDL
jgi:hypothetical protein